MTHVPQKNIPETQIFTKNYIYYLNNVIKFLNILNTFERFIELVNVEIIS